MIEQRLQFQRWGEPEHRTGGFVRFVEITMRDTAPQAYEVAGKGFPCTTSVAQWTEHITRSFHDFAAELHR